MSEKPARKVVSDASKLPTSADHGEIRKQVEFYFGDTNLPRDKFLWQTSQKDHGWVPIATIHSFSRMKRFQPFEEVVGALKESEFLEVNEDSTKVRRRVPLGEPKPEEKREAFERTVYAKGFGPETETSQFDIESFFEKYGPTTQVRLRRSDDGAFKSSVFVEFKSLEDAKAFVEAKPSFNEQELLVMSKQAYVDMKAAEHSFTANANGRRRKFNAFAERNKSRATPARGKRMRDTDQYEKGRKRRARDSEEPTAEKVTSEPVTSEATKEVEVEGTSNKDSEPQAEKSEETQVAKDSETA